MPRHFLKPAKGETMRVGKGAGSGVEEFDWAQGSHLQAKARSADQIGKTGGEVAKDKKQIINADRAEQIGKISTPRERVWKRIQGKKGNRGGAPVAAQQWGDNAGGD